MNKREFLARLCNGLSLLPREELDERLTFYNEMIDDRTEEGLSEEEAVHSIGSVDAIIEQIRSEYSREKSKGKQKRRLRAWEIVLLALGSPIWLSLLIAAFAVFFSLYAASWAILASLWAVFAALLVSTPALLVAGIVILCGGRTLPALALLSSAAILAGLTIFLFFGCLELTKQTLLLTRKLFLCLKHHFSEKEATQ